MNLPVCDHYAGVAKRIEKALALQAQTAQASRSGQALIDVTLDCEDGAPVGGEREHAQMIAAYLSENLAKQSRIGVRVHNPDHAAFAQDLEIILQATKPAYIVLPKIDTAEQAAKAISAVHILRDDVPIHCLIESAAAVQNVARIAALPSVASLSLGAMDFVSSFGGALPARAMSALGQFDNPVVNRAKLDLSLACHAAGKTPSHCAIPEYQDEAAFKTALAQARAMGYTRAWSIHPNQIEWILQAFAPSEAEINTAYEIIFKASAASWAPISYNGVLQDRASYRYYWGVLQTASQTQSDLPEEINELLRQGYAAGATL